MLKTFTFLISFLILANYTNKTTRYLLQNITGCLFIVQCLYSFTLDVKIVFLIFFCFSFLITNICRTVFIRNISTYYRCRTASGLCTELYKNHRIKFLHQHKSTCSVFIPGAAQNEINSIHLGQLGYFLLAKDVIFFKSL